MSPVTIGIVSDIHYASPAEQARGSDYELRRISNPLVRSLLKGHRRYVWLHDALHQNHLLDRFLASPERFDFVVANGDYTCDTGFVGLSDDAARQSVHECIEKLAQKYGAKLRVTFGDHELGKTSLFGGHGGMRVESFRRGQELGIAPFWRLELGDYVLLGVTSSLIALPVFNDDILPEELSEWNRLREEHLELIRQSFAKLRPGQRVLLFCHDPTALPFLWDEESVRTKLPQLEHTIIGHLHSRLIFWNSRKLAGLPKINFMGNGIRRMSTALNNAHCWPQFKIELCPSLAGIELLKDGGYLVAQIDPETQTPARIRFEPIPR